jgi:hypothetical protein
VRNAGTALGDKIALQALREKSRSTRSLLYGTRRELVFRAATVRAGLPIL